MKSYGHILVGIDFSPASLAAFRTASRIAAMMQAPLTAIHVIEPPLLEAMKKAHQSTAEKVLQHVSKGVREFINNSKVCADAVQVDVDTGHPFLCLMEACPRHGADLLILGMRGTEHGPNQIGAIAAKCVRKAPADVLLVRDGMSRPFRHLTACVDFSETSAKAMRVAGRLASGEGAALDGLFVYQTALVAMDYGGFLPAIPVAEDVSAQALALDLDAFMVAQLKEFPRLRSKPVLLERINVREAILEHVRDSKTDLVVLGTRGKSDLRSLLVGTTAEKVVTHAPCSILAVKPDMSADL